MSEAGQRWAEEAVTAAEVIRRAGDLLLGGQREPRDVRHKEGDGREPVTDGDLAADKLIRAALAERFPRDEVLTEETPAADPGAGRRWVVDPLDGTANYILGLPFWAISLALEVGGDCVVGAVRDPIRDDSFEVVGKGSATCNGTPIRVSRAGAPETSVAAILLLPSSQMAAGLTSLVDRFRGVRQLGATALELAWVAAGRLDACVFRRDNRIWDWIAGAALVRAAGGTVRPLGDPGQGIAIAAGPELSEACLQSLSLSQVAS